MNLENIQDEERKVPRERVLGLTVAVSSPILPLTVGLCTCAVRHVQPLMVTRPWLSERQAEHRRCAREAGGHNEQCEEVHHGIAAQSRASEDP
jgi:hypothetical protein